MSEWIITSSLLILIMAAMRKLLRGRIRPLLQYALWGIVLLRLLVPFSFFESNFSVKSLLGSLRDSPLPYTPAAPEKAALSLKRGLSADR